MELLRRNWWRLISVQLSNKFGYFASRTVSIILQFRNTRSCHLGWCERSLQIIPLKSSTTYLAHHAPKIWNIFSWQRIRLKRKSNFQLLIENWDLLPRQLLTNYFPVKLCKNTFWIMFMFKMFNFVKLKLREINNFQENLERTLMKTIFCFRYH